MPTFRARRPSGIAESIATMLSSSPTLSASDIMKADQLQTDIAHKTALAEKARLEVENERLAHQMRTDPALMTDFAANVAGLTRAQGQGMRDYYGGRDFQATAPVQMDDEGQQLPPAIAQRPAGVTDPQARLFQSTIGAAFGNLLATGKTNAEQLAKAGGELQGQGITQTVQDLIARGDVARASALSQGGKLGSPIKLVENIAGTGATFEPATGAVRTDNPLAASTITKNQRENNKASELAGLLSAAGIDPASPQGQQLFRALAMKTATHAPSASSTTNVVMKQETEEAKAVGKALGESFNDIQKSGADAGSKINRYDRLWQLLEGVNTGKLTPAGTELAAWAESVGIKVDPKLGNKQAARALANELALQLRNPSGGAGMPGAMSDKDREFLVAMTPSLANTAEGNKLLIETAKKLAQRDQQVARLAREYRKKHGSMDPGFYEELQRFADANPLFPQARAGTATPGRTVIDFQDTERRATPRDSSNPRKRVTY